MIPRFDTEHTLRDATCPHCGHPLDRATGGTRAPAAGDLAHHRLVPSIVCPRCGLRSFNPEDIATGYCGACHDWTGRP